MLNSRLISGALPTSTTFHSLPPVVQDRFYRYLLLADGFGCFEANIHQIKGVAWPLRPDVKTTVIERDLVAFEKVGMIEVWSAPDGRRYAFWKKFFLFNRLRLDFRQRIPTPPSVEAAGGWKAYIDSIEKPRDALYTGQPATTGANPRQLATTGANPRQLATTGANPLATTGDNWQQLVPTRASWPLEGEGEGEGEARREGEDSPPIGGQRPAPEAITRNSASGITRARVHARVSNGTAAAQAAEVLRYLNGKVDKPFPVAGPSLRLVIERLTDRECPVSVPQLKALIDDRHRRWGRNPEWRQNLRPGVLFGEKNCAEWAAMATPAPDVKAVGKCYKCGKPAPGSVVCGKCKAEGEHRA